MFVLTEKKKKKIDPWLTAGILKSINSKDKLYKALLQTHKDLQNYPALLSNFKLNKNIIRRMQNLANYQ